MTYCACGVEGEVDVILAHVRHKLNVEQDRRYYANGGHAVLVNQRPPYVKCPHCTYADYGYKVDEHALAMRTAGLGHE